MWKWIVVSLSALVLIAIGGVSYIVFNDEINTRLSQYVQLNTHKNWGIRKQILQTTGALLSFNKISQSEPVTIDPDSLDVGAKPTQSDISALKANAVRVLEVTSAKQLVNRLKKAKPGDLLLIQPGTYVLKERYQIKMASQKQGQAPVVIAAETLGTVELQLWSVEGFYISSPNWVFKNLVMRGMCKVHGRCQHAMHIFGNADNLLVENNKFINFNAAIKANGDYSDKPAKFPDNVRVFYNDFYNETLRKTNSPASPIDVVGGDNWHIKGNFIADFSRKLKGKQSIVYGAFLKGGGKNGLIEDNLVNCAWKLPHQSKLDIRLGLSLGDGGTGKKFCQVKNCLYEHANGVIRNNVVMNCHNDVSIYLNKAHNTQVINNVLIGSLGIDARFPATSATFSGNTLDGRIKSRDGASIVTENNTIN